MLAQSLRISRSVVARTTVRQPVMARSIAYSAMRQVDAVQAIYLSALREYKPKPESLADAEGSVKKWAVPAAPPKPDSADAAAFKANMQAYKEAAVEVEGQETAADGVVAAKEEDWFEEEAAFGTAEEAKL